MKVSRQRIKQARPLWSVLGGYLVLTTAFLLFILALAVIIIFERLIIG
ncbi:MAG: hypothetical protein LBC35_00860 [Coriobacteriales bacterium]|jgi:hypothetical protein|nr:hypothetical protein [Coriobacteriales bacterium]